MRWYRIVLKSFPDDPTAAQNNFLLAELLFEDKQFADASREYEKAAYDYPVHAKSADAGYAALLAYAEQEKALAPTATAPLHAVPAARWRGQCTALRRGLRRRPAHRAGADPRRREAVRTAGRRAGRRRGAAGAGAAAAGDRGAAPRTPGPCWRTRPSSAPDFDQAERAYVEVLALLPAQDAARNDMVERLAASVYKQGEARARGRLWRATRWRTSRAWPAVAPQSAVRANAQYDAAAALIGLKDWDGAARTLEDFRQRYPNHALQAEVGNKLTVAYLEQQRWAPAAAELERVAASQTDPQMARASLWQAAELYDKAGSRDAAAKAYGQYVARFPQPLEPAVEARWRMAGIAKAEAQPARELALMQDIFHADQGGGDARSPRTRYLGGMASLALAAPAFEAYRKVELVEPLARAAQAEEGQARRRA